MTTIAILQDDDDDTFSGLLRNGHYKVDIVRTVHYNHNPHFPDEGLVTQTAKLYMNKINIAKTTCTPF